MDGFGARTPSATLDDDRPVDGLFGLFHEGMCLARETADFLDGLAGRQPAAGMGEARAINEAAIRLTAQVRTLASWLVLQRSANLGGIDSRHALNAQRAMRFPALERSENPELPAGLRGLIARANALQLRIVRIQAELYRRAPELSANAVERQIAGLRRALNTL